MSKVRIRLEGTGDNVEQVRKHLLKNHPQMILGKLVKNPGRERSWFVFGDYTIGQIRRRYNQ